MADLLQLGVNAEVPLSNVESESTAVQQATSDGATLIDSSFTSSPAHSALQWLHASEESYPWIKNGTIRSPDTPLLKFVHLNIPEDSSSLITHLRDLQGSKFDLTTWARALLFRVLADGFTSTLQRIPDVKAAWLQRGQELGYGRPGPGHEPVRASLSVTCALGLEDHQIMRSLWCITCTHAAASNLAVVAGIPIPIPLSEWIQHEQDPPYPEIRALRSLSGFHAFYASFFCLQFGLKVTPTTNSTTTTTLTVESEVPRAPLVGDKDKASQETWRIILSLARDDDNNDNNDNNNASRFLLDHDTVITSVPRTPLPQAITAVLTIRREDNPPAFLIHVVDSKVDALSGRRPSKWCLMVLKHDTDFRDHRELAALLREEAKESSVVALEHKIDEMDGMLRTADLYLSTPEDGRFLEDWGDSLACDQNRKKI